jgi:hypothetical protein
MKKRCHFSHHPAHIVLFFPDFCRLLFIIFTMDVNVNVCICVHCVSLVVIFARKNNSVLLKANERDGEEPKKYMCEILRAVYNFLR